VLALFLLFLLYRIINKTDTEKPKVMSVKEGDKAMPYIIWSRKCRKCKGQFYLEESEDGNYLTCIQCGYSEKIVDPELIALLSAIQPTRKKGIAREATRELTGV